MVLILTAMRHDAIREWQFRNQEMTMKASTIRLLLVAAMFGTLLIGAIGCQSAGGSGSSGGDGHVGHNH